MFRRFAAGASVASMLIAAGALAVVTLGDPLSRFTPLLAAWCIVPLVWGVWTMLTPHAWMPVRLPLWGAVLGVVAGMLASYVLDLPRQVFQVELSGLAHAAAVVVAAALYAALWMGVKLAWRTLETGGSKPAPE